MEDDDSDLLQKLLLRKKELLERKQKLEAFQNDCDSKPESILARPVLNKELDSNKLLDKETSQERSLQDITNASCSSNDIVTNQRNNASNIFKEKPKNVFIPSSSDSSDVISTSTVCFEMSNSFFHDNSSYTIPDINQEVTNCPPISCNTLDYPKKNYVKIISNINITELDPIMKKELLSNLKKTKKRITVESMNIPDNVLFLPKNASTPCKHPTSDLSGGVSTLSGHITETNLSGLSSPSPSNLQKFPMLSGNNLPSKLPVDETTSLFNDTGTSDLPSAKCSTPGDEFAAAELPDQGTTPHDITGTLDLPAKCSTPGVEFAAAELHDEVSTPLDVTGTLDLPAKCSTPGIEFAAFESPDESSTPLDVTGTLDLPAKCSTPGIEFAAFESPDESSTPLDVTGTLDLPAKCSTPGVEFAAAELLDEVSTPLDVTGTLDLPAKCSTPGIEFAAFESPDESSTPLDVTGTLDLPAKCSTPGVEFAAAELLDEVSTPLDVTGTLDLPAKCSTPGIEFAAFESPDESSTPLDVTGTLDLPAKCSTSGVEFAASELPDEINSPLDVTGTLNVPVKCSTPGDEIVVAELLDKASTQQKKKKRKCKPLKFKKEHIDFLSDEELHFPDEEDFSPGSSDEWSEKESDASDSTDIANDRKKKRRKKKKELIKTSKQSNEYKKKRKNNIKKIRKQKREKGETYETFSGKMKIAKSVQENPCKLGKCSRACYEIADDRRQNIFKYFWNLDTPKKRDWLVQCSSRVPIKRKKTDAVESKRNHTYEYYINEEEGRRQVCQQFILKTLDITQTFLLYTITNANEGLSQEEKRKRTAVKVYDEATLNATKKYIENLPLLPSHYCRKATNKLYLPQEFKNTTNLFRLYRKWCEENKEKNLSERLFINLFRSEYSNITVHVPKKDKCKICAKEENNPKEVNQDSEAIKVHIEEKEATYERFHSHQQLNTIDKSIIVSSFDLQKVLNTPHGDNILLFYTRKYTVYNFTVYESCTQNGFCYTWGESDGKRGSKEIGSCLFQYLKNVDDRGIRKVILYCDSCAGQNRNKTILSILNYFLSISQNVEIIQINYLLPGHSYMPVDSMHSVIEREVRKLTVWSYTQWPSYMESARKNPRPYTVNVLEHKDFIDWDPVVEKVFNTDTKALQISKIRIATLKKKDLSILKVKNSMKVDAASREIEINKKETVVEEPARKRRKIEQSGRGKWKGKGKGKRTSKCVEVASTIPAAQIEENPSDCEALKLKPLYAKRLPISNLKYIDLKKLCNDGVIPNRFHSDFLKLPFTSTKKDTLMETDEEDS